MLACFPRDSFFVLFTKARALANVNQAFVVFLSFLFTFCSYLKYDVLYCTKKTALLKKTDAASGEGVAVVSLDAVVSLEPWRWSQRISTTTVAMTDAHLQPPAARLCSRTRRANAHMTRPPTT